MSKNDSRSGEERLKEAYEELGALQRTFRIRQIPAIIVVEGWNASGISDTIATLLQGLDPRGFDFHALGRPGEEDRAHTFLRRFWVRTPAHGRIAIYARSWYSRALAEKIRGTEWEKRLDRAITSIKTFERQLADDGTLILKFFLQISSEEQRRRLVAREKDPLTSWMITRNDWDFHHLYDELTPVIRHIREATEEPWAAWHIVDAEETAVASERVLSTVIERFRAHLDTGGSAPLRAHAPLPPLPSSASPIDTVDLSLSMSRHDYDRVSPECQARLRACQYSLYRRKVPLIIVYEGWDAAGKGGSIQRLVRSMNPRGYAVVPVGPPSSEELAHHFLWRFYLRFPPAGDIRIFDRSWYGRVLVERVEGLASEHQWQRAYREICEMERAYVESGGGLIKFWLEIDAETQLKRFRERETDPSKQWKITEEDWRNREKREQYERAVREMIARTHTPSAPWTVIASNSKHHARITAQRAVIDYVNDLI
ncbi:MAG: polyphosphate:AMP phosphotransferase [Methanospirillum sp.]|nr:polyphosphate:AMP phosphotransferase [Methanospirillum sp.]